MRLINLGIAALAILLTCPALAVEEGTALKADEIKSEPFSDAKSIATLAVGDKVGILNRDGGWLNIKSAKGSGWVRMLSIRKGDASKGGGDLAGVLGMVSGRAGTGKVVSTTGIRGLNEEELKTARFNADELKLAESFFTTRVEAEKFAKNGKLKSQQFDYLPEPKKEVNHE